MTALITPHTVTAFTDEYLTLVRDLSATGTHRDDPQINVIVEAEAARRSAPVTQPVGATRESPTRQSPARQSPAKSKKAATPKKNKTRPSADTPSREMPTA